MQPANNYRLCDCKLKNVSMILIILFRRFREKVDFCSINLVLFIGTFRMEVIFNYSPKPLKRK